MRMPRQRVLKHSQFKDKPDEYIDGMLLNEGFDVQSNQLLSREEKIDLLVKRSYPRVKLPKFRHNSTRGVVLGFFVSQDGTPTKGAVLSEVCERLLSMGRVETKEAAVRAWNQYTRDLVRYYGYELVEVEDRLVAKRRES